jgi:hypothetical protein
MWQVWETGQDHTGSCSVNVSERAIHPRWKENITMDLNEIGCEGVDWSGLAQDRDGWRTLANTVTNVPFV